MHNNEYTVSVHPAAQDRLAAHLEFLAFISENAADKLFGAYEDAILFLSEYPESCPMYLPNPRYRYKLFGKRYRIVFEIVEKAVYADDIQDCRQDMDKNLV